MFGIDDSVLAVGNLELWPSERQVFVAGQRVGVAPREFDVLLALAACHGHVVAREHLYRNVWGRGPGPRDRSLDFHVSRIRQHLREAAPGWTYIHTHFRHGYRLEPEPSGRGRRGRAK